MSISPDAVTFGAVATLASSLTAAAISLKKVKPDVEKTTVSVAGEAVIVQSNVIKDLNGEIERLKRHTDDCEKEREVDRKSFHRALNEVREECRRTHIPKPHHG